jgi:AraC-like DNA-binding protein
LVPAVLSGRKPKEGLRTVQRRFVRATGLSNKAILVTERAHAAAFLLRDGASILDTVAELGFADQPHLTRSLKRLLGVTPAQLASETCRTQLSFMPPLDPR